MEMFVNIEIYALCQLAAANFPQKPPDKHDYFLTNQKSYYLAPFSVFSSLVIYL